MIDKEDTTSTESNIREKMSKNEQGTTEELKGIEHIWDGKAAK